MVDSNQYIVHILVPLMHQSFVTTPPPSPTHREGWGIAGLKCRQLLFGCPLSAGEMTGFDIRILIPGRFSIAKGGEKRAKF